MKEATKQVSVEGIMKAMEEIVSKGLTGCSFAHIRTVTTPKFLKKSRTTGMPLPNASDIRKVSEFGCGLGYDYVKSIENRLVKEGKDISAYEAGETWHQAFNGSKVIREHKKTGEKYFYVSLNTNNSPSVKFVNVVTGEEIDKASLVDFLPTESAPTNQGLSEGNEVQVRTLKLESLKGLSACGEVFEVL